MQHSFYKPHYIKGIDALRAFAVIAVMLFHIYPQALPGGFTGVDIFFVISGYVVSSSLAKNYRENFFKFTIDFYARRIIRLIPILLIFLLLSSVITTLFIPSSWLSDTTSKTALSAFFGFSNFALVWYNDGYFSPRVEFNPFVHTWSLSVEEQFYLIFPLIFFIWYRFKAHQNSYISIGVKSLLATLIITSLIYAWYETSANPEHAFYLLPSRFWELGLGALLFKLHSQNKLLHNSNLTHKLYLISGLILITTGFFFADEKLFPFPWAIPSTIGTLFLIISFVNSAEQSSIHKAIFQNKAIVYIGKISYSLYLWHWTLYAFFRWTVGLQTLPQMLSAVVLTFILAILSYHLIETPFRKSTYIKKQANYKVVLASLVVIFMAYTITKQIFNNQPTLSLSVTKDTKTWYPHPYPQETKLKKDLSKHKIFVLGDSHTGAYSTMLQQLTDEYKIEVIKFSSGGCGVADFHTPSISKNPTCIKYIENTLSHIESIASSGDILFLASLRMVRLCDQYALFNIEHVKASLITEEAVQNRKYILEDTSAIIKRFEAKNITVLIDAPKPTFKAPPFRCSDYFNSTNPICKEGFSISKDELLQNRKYTMESLETLKSQFPKLLIWDPLPILCKTEVCSAFDGNKPLFFDGDHLSGHGNRVLYPSFKAQIEEIYTTKAQD